MKEGIPRQRDRMVKAFARPVIPPSFLLIVLLLIAPALILVFAYASPPDPSWIPGVYDDADYDDVVTLVTSASAHAAPGLPVDSRPILPSIGRVPSFVEHPTLAPSRFASHPRAPPL